MKPRLLDLFCGAGGCTKGYQRAGFYVVGVDINPQPNYCGDAFILCDALTFLDGGVPIQYEAIHASPPCQGYTTMAQRWENDSPRLIDHTRALISATGLPYVIENVMGARKELRNPHRVCGSSLGLDVHRHRLFETSFDLMVPPCSHAGRRGVAVYGKLDGRRLWTRADGSELRAVATLEEARDAMGIDWMGWDELREAIPPAYTELIGAQLIAQLAMDIAA